MIICISCQKEFEKIIRRNTKSNIKTLDVCSEACRYAHYHFKIVKKRIRASILMNDKNKSIENLTIRTLQKLNFKVSIIEL